MTNITNLEKDVLLATLAFWNYGDETELEDNAVIFNVKELKDETGHSLKTLKGVVGSLFKKGLLCEMESGEMGNRVEIGITEDGIKWVLDTIEKEDGSIKP